MSNMGGSVPTIPGVKISGELLDYYRRLVGVSLLGRRNTSFPGAQPVSFARHHFEELEARE
jgi:mRNA guanylyltransferase